MNIDGMSEAEVVRVAMSLLGKRRSVRKTRACRLNAGKRKAKVKPAEICSVQTEDPR